MPPLLDAYDSILSTLETAAKEAHVSIPQLMVVSKNQSCERLLPLVERGHRLFGENRVHEALTKWEELRKKYIDLRLHLIGHLQRNKVSEALTFFDTIETIDRFGLVDAIVDFRDKFPDKVRTKQFLIQVNIGRESQKFGVDPDELGELYRYCGDHGLVVAGLMCLPPAGVPPHSYFDLMQKLSQKYEILVLSMGMSDDYTIATQYGSSWVRIGTAIFESMKSGGRVEKS